MTTSPSDAPSAGPADSLAARIMGLPLARVFGLFADRLSGLHLQLMGLIIVPFAAALLAVAVLGVRVHHSAMKQLIADRDVRGTRAAAAATGQSLFHFQTSIQATAQQFQAAYAQQAAAMDVVDLLHEFDAGYRILDRSGRELDSSHPAPAWQADLLLRDLPPPSTVRTVHFTDRGNSVVLLVAAEAEVVAIGGVSLQQLAKAALLSSMVTSDSSGAFLVDQSGSLLYYVGARPSAPDLLMHPGVAEGLRGESGSTFRQAEGEEWAVAFSPVPNSAWALVFEEPWQEVTSPVLDLSLLAPLALAPILVITLLGLWFGARQVIRPLRELQEQTESAALGAQAFERGSRGGIAEVRQLRSSLAQMAGRIAGSQAALQRYIGTITNAQEEERSRLARELHDETIQGLIAIDHRIQLLALEHQNQDSQLTEALQSLHAEITQSVNGLRRMAKALRPLLLEDLGLVPALNLLVEEIKRSSSVDIEFNTLGETRRLGSQAELAVYRIVQEALNNVARHSVADSARVTLRYSDQAFQVTVQDSGIGYDLPATAGELAGLGHFGLINMRERAELIGAELEISSSGENGTTVRLHLPLGTHSSAAERQTA